MNRYYYEGMHSTYYEFTRPEVIELVRPKGLRILDVGCASGAMGAAMLEQGATEVYGIEPQYGPAQIAKARLSRVFEGSVEQAMASSWLEQQQFARKFDCVTCADVLEHLVDPWSVLRSLVQCLRPGGAVVVSIPNVAHHSVLLPLLARREWQYEDAGVLDRTHLRFFTRKSALRMLAEAGLGLVYERPVCLPLPEPKDDFLARVAAELCDDEVQWLLVGVRL